MTGRTVLRVAAKRAIDAVGALFGIVIASPVMAACAVLIRVLDGRPVFYRQLRPGLDEKPFSLVKFRTMRVEVASGAEAVDDGSRITSLGSFLRRTSLDELPTLWNVLRGDMSLVGPRPLLMGYLERYTPEQARRHEVKPGITGLAQVNGRNAVDWPARLSLDVYYVDNWTIGMDLKILAMTVGQVVSGRGVSAPGHATMPEYTGEDID